MTTFEFRIIVTTSESVTEKELIDYLSFELGVNGTLSLDNPFIAEDSEVEIQDIDIF